MRSIYFVSAGLTKAKKSGNPISRFHHYLNYGLLGLASILDNKGYNAKVFHGNFLSPQAFIKEYLEPEVYRSEYPVFLSIPSVFAISWCKEFIHILKSVKPTLKIILGGRWVVNGNSKYIKNLIPDVDLIVYGTCENRIEDLLSFENWKKIPYTNISNNQKPETLKTNIPSYNYEILYNKELYSPSIEVSRGCGMGCNFCIEKNIPLQPIKPPKEIIAEIKRIQNVYQDPNLTFYFESSFFRPSSNWCKEFHYQYHKNKCTFKWRTETRIDSLSLEILTLLSESGLKVLDIGLESASEIQLKKMNKTTNTAAYLRRASKFLSNVHKLGIWNKVNILLYAGETFETLQETVDFLDKHKLMIKGVSVNPLIVYGFDNDTYKFIQEIQLQGASIIDKDWRKKGYTFLNLSEEISFQVSEDLRVELCKRYMNADDYFDLKMFSYLPRSFDREFFYNVLRDSDVSKLPFAI